jgi:SAM-dependent methyltransferase
MFFLEHIVPWGRSFDEYARFFDLSEDDLARRFIGCGDGPAGFNRELTARGGSIVSCDPLYQYSRDEIQARIEISFPQILEQVEHNRDLFIWDTVSSPQELGERRLSAMQSFLADYERGRREGRYCAAALPYLPFLNDSFDLAICSHLLFYYSDTLTESFHYQALREMLRVAPEVRIFPLVDLNGTVSRYCDTLVMRLKNDGYRVVIRPVPYEFIRGGNKTMIISARY